MIIDKKTLIEAMGIAEFLTANAKLAQKKNKLRAMLKEKGVLKREGNNTFDRYKYFSEAQYKELFTELFSTAGLELSFDEIEYAMFGGTERMPNGRMPKLAIYLTDTETGFFEVTTITGEALDKGDKAGYKGYTGAIKYYLATTFLVATGDEVEAESPEGKTGNKLPAPKAPVKQPAQPTRRPAQRPQQESPQAPAASDLETKIPIEAAKKLSLVIAEIAKEDQAWWPETREHLGVAKTTDILQRDYNAIVKIANDRLQELKGKKGGDEPW